MSIRTRSKCSNRPGRDTVRTTARGAFTLIELLVVVAIIAILMSILLPSLRAAREQARAVVCGQRLRDFANGMHSYFTDNQDWIPGVNTSGVTARRLAATPGAMNRPNVPVQSYDFATPILSRSIEMKAVRAERFKEILNTFHCPSQQTIKAILYGAGLSSSPDRTDFTTTDSNWTALSYLMPVHFQFFGQNYKDQALATLEANPAMVLYPRTAPDSWEALHETYKPLITRVGTPADKVAIADGTRYLTDTDTLDFDPSPDPGLFGSFTSAGAWWCGSTEYGVKSGTKNWNGRSVSGGQYPLAQGRNMELSYRHGPTRGAGLSGSARDNKGQINALFFDGSVRRLNDRQSRDPRPWYPKGTRITKAAEGMTDDLTNGSRVP